MKRAVLLVGAAIAAIAVIAVFIVVRQKTKRRSAPAAHGSACAQPNRESAETDISARQNEPVRLLPPVHSADVSESVRMVIDAVAKRGYIARTSAVRELGNPELGNRLKETELGALRDFLNRRQSEDALSVNELSSLKNDVVNVLRSQKVRPRDLCAHLMQMYNDPSNDTLWRGYCIQHLGLLYPSTADGAEKEAIRKTLWEATENVGTSIAPTALIALACNIGQEGVEAGRIKDAAVSVSQNADCGEPARITALQICANLSDERALPDARKLAMSEASVPLRMSAIAAVGAMGGQSDVAMLEEFVQSGDSRLRTAAQAALDRIGERMKQKAFGASSDIVQTH